MSGATPELDTRRPALIVPPMQSLRWGIVATGNIAETFAAGLRSSRHGSLLAVSSRDLANAKAFAAKHGAERAYGSIDALLADADVDAVYVSTPHPYHAETAIAAARAGKHVLCEKPIGMNAREAEAIFAAARAHKVHAMEAYMYRCHPQTARLTQLIASGAIGRPRHVQASFGFNAPFSHGSRLFDKSLGGGAILDVGGYPVSFACLIAGLAGDSPDASPRLQAMGELHPETQADTLALANLRFPSGLTAQASTSIQANLDNRARVFGDSGWIELPEPWIISRSGGNWAFTLHRDGQSEPERVTGHDPRGLYGIEADHFAAVVHDQSTEAPGMNPSSSTQVSRLLDQWRLAIGAVFPQDQQ